MMHGYEGEGTLEGDRVIRLDAPVPYKAGRVRVVVNPLDDSSDRRHQNQAALEALQQLLDQADDLTPGQWEELERVIEEYPVRIGRDSPG